MRKALAIVESGVVIDLLFTDVVMPGPLRGPELARKTRERLPEIAVLFTSGYTDNAIVHGGRLDAGVELLSKPCTREALARKIRHVLRNQKMRNSVTAVRMVRDAMPELARDDKPERALTILLVEDDGIIRMVTADMLTDLGHTVLEAESASEALEIFQRQPVDVLLTDIGLPDMSGRDLAFEARRRMPSLRLIFASGAGAPRPEDELAGAVILDKPYDSGQLAAALRTVAG